MSESHEQPFSLMLASSIHDMKNSLGMVIHSLDEMIDTRDGEGNCRCQPDLAARLQYEAHRVNDNLIQLLTLYRIENKTYTPQIEACQVADFLAESMAISEPLLRFRNISVEVICDEALPGYFDRELITGIINNVLTNAMRYTHDRLQISARHQDNFLVITIDDNGQGYPPAMLEEGARQQQKVSFTSGRTGLGLYFAAMVAAMHSDGERRGYIEVSNQSDIGGGRFRLFLP
jgi:signal transduction histidine kinase